MKRIPLTRGLFALVDDCDYEWLLMWNWHAADGRNGTFYAQASAGNGGMVQMHRLIMGRPTCKVDHRDGNGLNNQRYNLRKASDFENGWNKRAHSDNRSGFKGVTKHKSKWSARICVNHKTFCLGSFPTKEEAATAYNEAAIRHFGEFAKLNILGGADRARAGGVRGPIADQVANPGAIPLAELKKRAAMRLR